MAFTKRHSPQPYKVGSHLLTGPGLTDDRILTKCVRWIGEGRFLMLLQLLLQSGLDVGQIAPEVFPAWPSCSSNGWATAHVSDDPFFIIALRHLLEQESGKC